MDLEAKELKAEGSGVPSLRGVLRGNEQYDEAPAEHRL